MAADPTLRVPPQSLDSERALLGSLLLKPDAIHDVSDLIRADSFYAEKHRHIFECMRELTESGVRVVLELGPGRSLAKLVGESQPEIVVRSVADFRSWQGVIDWLQARLND